MSHCHSSFYAGDFHDCEIVLFSTSTFLTVASTQPTHTVHSVRWDPVAVGEFASVGEHASLCFWLLDECCGSNGFQLSLHEADVPSELMLSSDDVICCCRDLFQLFISLSVISVYIFACCLFVIFYICPWLIPFFDMVIYILVVFESKLLLCNTL